MKLSACMIVKDEEDVIERCLDSIIDHVDEVIVVDTGSSDDTVELMKYYEMETRLYETDEGQSLEEQIAYLHEIPWNGSFADMRNQSMDLATGDVLFIIDADEYVQEQDWKQIRQMIEMPDFIVGMAQIMNVAKGAVMGERVMQPRFFLNHPEIRYKYAIHNQIDDSYLAYARKFEEEHGRKALIVGTPFEIIHTGYELTPESAKKKYTSRAKICRDEVAKAIEIGQKRDEAYYKYQLALFLTMISDDDSEALALWDSIVYDNLNSYNRWYARYIASRTFMRRVSHDEDLSKDGQIYYMESALAHCAGMFDALDAPQTGYQEITPEPATWMITGIAMAEYGRIAGDMSTVNEGIVMMIDALLRALTPPQGMRCVINAQMLYNDIKSHFDPSTIEYKMLDTTDLKKGVHALKEIQQSLIHFDETLIELEDKEYL